MNERLAAFRAPLIAAAALIFWSTWRSGLATDDFVHLNNALRTPFVEMLLPTTYLSVPVLHYTHALAYALFGSQLWGYDILKGAYLLFVLFASVRFFRCVRRHSLRGAARSSSSSAHCMTEQLCG